MKIKKIVSGIILLCLLLSCSHENWHVDNWYPMYYNWFTEVERFAKKITDHNDNSFIWGDGFNYSIWSYRGDGTNNFLTIYKYKNKKLAFYRIYKYNDNLDWLNQYNEKVRKEIFYKFAILDGDPFFFNYKTNNGTIKQILNIHIDTFMSTDTLETVFLHTLRRDIIKYGLFNKEEYKPYD